MKVRLPRRMLALVMGTTLIMGGLTLGTATMASADPHGESTTKVVYCTYKHKERAYDSRPLYVPASGKVSISLPGPNRTVTLPRSVRGKHVMFAVATGPQYKNVLYYYPRCNVSN